MYIILTVLWLSFISFSEKHKNFLKILVLSFQTGWAARCCHCPCSSSHCIPLPGPQDAARRGVVSQSVGTQAHNPWVRKPVPYPLGHWGLSRRDYQMLLDGSLTFREDLLCVWVWMCIGSVEEVCFLWKIFLPLTLLSDALSEFVNLEVSELHTVGCWAFWRKGIYAVIWTVWKSVTACKSTHFMNKR